METIILDLNLRRKPAKRWEIISSKCCQAIFIPKSFFSLKNWIWVGSTSANIWTWAMQNYCRQWVEIALLIIPGGIERKISRRKGFCLRSETPTRVRISIRIGHLNQKAILSCLVRAWCFPHSRFQRRLRTFCREEWTTVRWGERRKVLKRIFRAWSTP